MIEQETMEELHDWLLYRDAHPDHHNTAEWADRLLRKIAKEVGADE